MIVRTIPKLAEFDAILMPTVPMVAPAMAIFDDDDDAFNRVNLALLRNPSTVNFLDGCAIRIPCHRTGEPPAGLSIQGSAVRTAVYSK